MAEEPDKPVAAEGTDAAVVDKGEDKDDKPAVESGNDIPDEEDRADDDEDVSEADGNDEDGNDDKEDDDEGDDDDHADNEDDNKRDDDDHDSGSVHDATPTPKRTDYWVSTFFTVGAGHALLALITIAIGNTIRGVSAVWVSSNDITGCASLANGVQWMVITAYLYMMLYGYLLLAPIPFKRSMSKVKIIFALFTSGTVVEYSLLTKNFSTSCEVVSLTFVYTAQLAMFWSALIAMVLRHLKYLLTESRNTEESNKWKEIEKEIGRQVEENRGVEAGQVTPDNGNQGEEGVENDQPDGDDEGSKPREETTAAVSAKPIRGDPNADIEVEDDDDDDEDDDEDDDDEEDDDDDEDDEDDEDDDEGENTETKK